MAVAEGVDRAFEELRARIAQYWDLAKVQMILFWDQRTMMPPGGAADRAEQLATLARLTHETLVSDETGRLLEEVRPFGESLEYDSDHASLLRWLRREYGKAVRVPVELRAELSRAAAQGLPVWERARRESDFGLFLPVLRHNFELRRQYVACFEPAEEDYDHLLDDFEPGMRTSEVRAIFDRLKEGLQPLLREVLDSEPPDDSFLHGTFPLAAQQELERRVLAGFGFTPESWRIDETVHPFASSAGIADIRLTTHHREHDLHSVFATMHEFGHGLYERQVGPELARTPLARGCSLGVHESQSRMWENLVGRSLPFWRRFYPDLQELFPSFGSVGLDAFYRAINRIRPSLIRIDADEVTYNFHIILRFELEQELLSGALDPADAPEAWDAKMQEYLGIDVPDVADGILQDMHWAGGNVGYFSTYSLGNIVSCQLWERIRADLPGLDDEFERGEFGSLRDWLAKHVHRHGRKYMPTELLERAVGGPIDPEPYLAYLRRKLGSIYGL